MTTTGANKNTGAYLESREQNERSVPPVQLLQLRRVTASAPFDYYGIGTEWCGNIFRRAPQGAKGRLGREWMQSAGSQR